MANFDYTKLKPYVITLTRNSSVDVSYHTMIKSGVSGVVVEAGYLYEASTHKVVNNFRNPLAYDQAQKALDSGLPIGWMMYARASNVVEANSEIYQLSFPIRKYSPMLGVWLSLELNGQSRQANDLILDKYRDELTRLGLKGKIGIRATKDSIKTVTWSDKQHDWNLWLVEHVSKTSEIEQLLDPKFFDMKGTYV